MLEIRTEVPEIASAVDAARQVVDRLIDLTLDREPDRARAIADALGRLGSHAAGAVVDAFPRAETRAQREHFLHVLGYASPHWHFEAQDLPERVARDDPDEGIRFQAEDVRQSLAGE